MEDNAISEEVASNRAEEPTPDRHAYLADSQFDYPISVFGGWQLLTLNKENVFGQFSEREASKNTATPLTYMVGGEDPHCLIGRDMFHGGHSQRPCLNWHPPRAGTYLLELEVSPILSIASGNILVSVYVDDVRMLSVHLDYPQRLAVSMPVKVGDRGFIRIVFACLKTIDSNHCMYFARTSALPDDATAATEENQAEYVQVDIDPSWNTLTETIQGSLPEHISAEELQNLARNLYGDSAIKKEHMEAFGFVVREQHMGHLNQKYRKPGFFTIKDSK